MSPVGRYLAFLAVYVVYLLGGGYMFRAIECPEEIYIKKRMAIQEREFQELMLLLSSHLGTVGEFLQDETQKSYQLPRNFFKSYHIPRNFLKSYKVPRILLQGHFFHNMKSKS